MEVSVTCKINLDVFSRLFKVPDQHHHRRPVSLHHRRVQKQTWDQMLTILLVLLWHFSFDSRCSPCVLHILSSHRDYKHLARWKIFDLTMSCWYDCVRSYAIPLQTFAMPRLCVLPFAVIPILCRILRSDRSVLLAQNFVTTANFISIWLACSCCAWWPLYTINFIRAIMYFLESRLNSFARALISLGMFFVQNRFFSLKTDAEPRSFMPIMKLQFWLSLPEIFDINDTNRADQLPDAWWILLCQTFSKVCCNVLRTPRPCRSMMWCSVLFGFENSSILPSEIFYVIFD